MYIYLWVLIKVHMNVPSSISLKKKEKREKNHITFFANLNITMAYRDIEVNITRSGGFPLMLVHAAALAEDTLPA